MVHTLPILNSPGSVASLSPKKSEQLFSAWGSWQMATAGFVSIVAAPSPPEKKQIGWQHKKLVEELEKKRKERAQRHWRKKVMLKRLYYLAVKEVDQIIPKLNVGDPRIKIGNL